MPHFLPLHKNILPVVMVLLPFTQENAVDVHSLGKIPLRLVMTVGEKHTDPIKNIRLYHCVMRFSFFVYIKTEIKFVHWSNHYRKSRHFLIHTKHYCTSAQCICHKQMTVSLPQRKILPRSTAKSMIALCIMLSVDYMYYLHIFTLFTSLFCFLYVVTS